MNRPDSNRRSVRLAQAIYTTGSHFITICTRNRVGILGAVRDCGVRLSLAGEIVRDEWLRTPEIRPGVTLGEWVIMPDHFHGIVHLPVNKTMTQRAVGKLGYLDGSLSSLIGGFKAACTRRYQAIRRVPGSMWQRGYYDHVIRNSDDLDAIGEYVRANPYRWMVRHQGQ